MIDKIKLALAVVIVFAGVYAFYQLTDQSELVRVSVLLGAIAVSVAVAMLSTQGKAAWEFVKGSRVELRKVVWPSNKETMQVTLSVFVIVVLIALFLWLVDWGLTEIVSAVTK